MPTVWLTYAWADNEAGDVDFVAQELGRHGLTVKLDRWNLKAGVRLWEQIAQFIQDPTQSDAWLIYATQISLGSEACKEEFAYALDRALKSRGAKFPVIGVFPATVDDALIPPGIKTRLYVSLRDPDWHERIRAAAEGRLPSIAQPVISPYHLKLHPQPAGADGKYVIEVRPRAGAWSPFVAAVPAAEGPAVRLRIMHGTAGRLPMGGILFNTGEGTSPDGQWAFVFAGNEATPTQSYYIYCDALPTKMLFGPDGGTQYVVERLA